MKAPSFGMSGMPLFASEALSAAIPVCHASIHVVLPSSPNVLPFAAAPARRGSCFAPLPPRHPGSSDGDAGSK